MWPIAFRGDCQVMEFSGQSAKSCRGLASKGLAREATEASPIRPFCWPGRERRSLRFRPGVRLSLSAPRRCASACLWVSSRWDRQCRHRRGACAATCGPCGWPDQGPSPAGLQRADPNSLCSENVVRRGRAWPLFGRSRGSKTKAARRRDGKPSSRARWSRRWATTRHRCAGRNNPP